MGNGNVVPIWLVVSSGDCKRQMVLFVLVSLVIVIKRLDVPVTSDFHDGGSLDLARLHFVDESFASTVVCESLHSASLQSCTSYHHDVCGG